MPTALMPPDISVVISTYNTTQQFAAKMAAVYDELLQDELDVPAAYR